MRSVHIFNSLLVYITVFIDSKADEQNGWKDDRGCLERLLSINPKHPASTSTAMYHAKSDTCRLYKTELQSNSCLIEEKSCYTKQCDWSNYKGSINRTYTGQACLAWKPNHKAKLSPNNCRSFGKTQPWCFVDKDGYRVKKYCFRPCEDIIRQTALETCRGFGGRWRPSHRRGTSFCAIAICTRRKSEVYSMEPPLWALVSQNMTVSCKQGFESSAGLQKSVLTCAQGRTWIGEAPLCSPIKKHYFNNPIGLNTENIINKDRARRNALSDTVTERDTNDDQENKRNYGVWVFSGVSVAIVMISVPLILCTCSKEPPVTDSVESTVPDLPMPDPPTVKEEIVKKSKNTNPDIKTELTPSDTLFEIRSIENNSAIEQDSQTGSEGNATASVTRLSSNTCTGPKSCTVPGPDDSSKTAQDIIESQTLSR